MLIKFYEQPFIDAEPEVFEHRSICEWLLEKFGAFPKVTLQVFEGEPALNTDITHDLDLLMSNRAEFYTVLQSPGGDTGKLIGALLLGPIGLSLFALSAIIPKSPSYAVADQANVAGRSSNNELGERSNKVRVLQRIEDIYGTVRSIPSLIMPSYTKWIDHIQYEYSYLCVGRGYYSISDLRDSETPLSENGARAAIYDPFTSPNSGSPVATIGDAIEDTILTVKRSNEVDGITLKALNQIQLPALDNYDFVPAANWPASGDVIQQQVKKPNMNTIMAAGDMITVTMTPIIQTITSSAISAAASDDSFNSVGLFSGLTLIPGSTITVTGGTNAGNYTVVSKTSSKIVVSASLLDEAAGTPTTITNDETIDYSGEYEIDTVEDGYIVLTTSTFSTQYNDYSSNVTLQGVSEYTNWVTLPITDRSQVWANLLCVNGLYKDAGGGKTLTDVTVEIEIEQLTAELVATGVVETVTETLSGATSDLRASTVEQLTAFTGPCRVRARRTSDYDYDYGGLVVDEIKLVDLYSVTPVTALNFGNCTTIYTVTKATLRALAAKQRQLNCLASRLLPTYDGTAFSGAFDATGLHVSGTIHATSRWIDILPAISIDPFIGRRAITELDMRQLYAVHQAIEAWEPTFNEFNYTLDSDNLSYEDTVSMIADAVFCKPYRQNGLIRFGLQRAHTSTNLPTFCHRNKKPDSETITRSFSNDGEYDGIEFIYQDPDTERSETIRLPADSDYTKLRKVEIPGIRNFGQAWVRANRDYNRLVKQRQVLEFEATTDARMLLPGTRIDVVDDTRFKRYGGEVIGQSGLEITLSQPVEFTSGDSHSIILMKRDGTTQSIACSAGSNAYKVVLAGLPAESLVTSYSGEGIRTIYSFAADSLRLKQSWLVEEIIPSDSEYIRIRAVNYTPDYYVADYGELPSVNEIIY